MHGVITYRKVNIQSVGFYMDSKVEDNTVFNLQNGEKEFVSICFTCFWTWTSVTNSMTLLSSCISTLGFYLSWCSTLWEYSTNLQRGEHYKQQEPFKWWPAMAIYSQHIHILRPTIQTINNAKLRTDQNGSHITLFTNVCRKNWGALMLHTKRTFLLLAEYVIFTTPKSIQA